MAIGNKFQPLTNDKKNSIFLCGGDSRYQSVDTLPMKKHASFPSLICPVFYDKKRFFTQYVKFHAFSILAIQLTR